jgi:hypothetical protein
LAVERHHSYPGFVEEVLAALLEEVAERLVLEAASHLEATYLVW